MTKRPLTFLREWVRNPLRTASVFPSGKALANLLTTGLGPQTGRVIELGAGTGAITSAILSLGVEASRLTLVEINPDFVAHLRRAFPGVTVIQAAAENLNDVLPPHDDPTAGPIGAVISGLPFMTLPPRTTRRILASAFSLMCPNGESGGNFSLFTYGPKVPIAPRILHDLHLTATRRGFALGNIPPASVYALSRVQSEASP